MSFITVAGENKIADRVANHLPLNVAYFVFANVPSLGVEPSDRIEALPSSGYIVDTKAVANQGYVSPNKVVYSIILDSSVGDYQFNWVGLKDADGVLIACEHLPLTTKTKTAGLIQGNNLARNFLLEFSGAQSVTGINTPAETWQFNFNNRLLQIDERERLSNFDTYGAAMFFDTGFLVTHSSLVVSMAAGLAFVGGVRCSKSSVSTLTVSSFPKDIYIDASLQGDISGVDAVIAFTASTTTISNYTDSLGFAHYVYKIASIDAGGVVTDLRPLWADIYLKRSDQPSQVEAEAMSSITPRAWTAQRVGQSIAAKWSDVTQAEAEAGALTTNRLWTPLRVKQAIVKNGLIASGITTVTATGTLTTAAAGSTVVINCATANTQTLPSAEAFGVCRIEFVNIGLGAATITRAGSDTLKMGNGSATSFILTNGDTTTLESDGVNSWYLVNKSNSLANVPNVERFPDGTILQRGTVFTNASGYINFTFPLSFPAAIEMTFFTGYGGIVPGTISSSTLGWLSQNFIVYYGGAAAPSGIQVNCLVIGH
jgi:hypothetical protein